MAGLNMPGGVQIFIALFLFTLSIIFFCLKAMFFIFGYRGGVSGRLSFFTFLGAVLFAIYAAVLIFLSEG